MPSALLPGQSSPTPPITPMTVGTSQPDQVLVLTVHSSLASGLRLTKEPLYPLGGGGENKHCASGNARGGPSGAGSELRDAAFSFPPALSRALGWWLLLTVP